MSPQPFVLLTDLTSTHTQALSECVGIPVICNDDESLWTATRAVYRGSLQLGAMQ